MDQYEKLIKGLQLFQTLNSNESSEEKCQKILDYLNDGGDVNTADNIDNGNTLLHVAVRQNDLNLVNLLLSKNANVSITNRVGETPLILSKSLSKNANFENITSVLENHSKIVNTDTIKEKEENNKLLEYKKRPGTSGVRGQLYETKLSSLILFRALNDKMIAKFYLGTNIAGVGDLDDICFKYAISSDATERMVFIQAKHKDDPEKTKVSVADLKNSASDFSLAKYFNSYLGIKKMFKKNNKDIMFRGEFNEVDCVLVLYTPARSNIPEQYKITNTKTPHQIENILGIKRSSEDVFQLNDIHLVLEATAPNRIQAIADVLKSSILIDNDKKYSNLMSNDLMKQYHVAIAQKVINVLDVKTRQVGNEIQKYREGRFRAEFFTSEELLVKTLREKLFEGITAEILEEYKTKCFNLPNTFGNVDLHVQKPQRINDLANDFNKLFRKTPETAIIKIDENIFQKNYLDKEEKPIEKGFVKLNGGIAGLVGNLLIFDEESKFLKFNSRENLFEGNAKNLLNVLLDSNDKDKFYQYRLDINLTDFPTLFLDGDVQDRYLAREFLNKLWFFTNQPMEFQVENDLIREIERDYLLQKRDKLLRIQSDAIYLKFHDAIQKWWLNQKNPKYLTTGCDYLEKSKNNVIDSPKLSVLDFVFMNKIRKNEIKFYQSALQTLGVEEFLKEQACNILNIISCEGFLTAIKIAQYFENNTEVDVTFLDFEFIVNEDYYDMVEYEIQDKKLPKISVFVFIHKREVDSDKLFDLIGSVCTDLRKKIIIVSEFDISNQIASYTNKQCISSKDVQVFLNDIKDTENILPNWTFVFQDEEIKFNELIDENSQKLIHSEILWKLINNEHIKIGKPFVHPRYDEVREYCRPRSLSRGDEFLINSLKDINENVIIISAEPGMGKSVLLSQLALNTKELEQKSSHQSTWIVYINLQDYCSEFERWQNEKIIIDLVESLRFIYKVAIDGLEMVNSQEKRSKGNQKQINAFKISVNNEQMHLKTYSKDAVISFQLHLFKHFYEKGQVVFMLDGFDEICPDYEQEVTSLLKQLTASYHASNCEILRPSYAGALSVLQNPMSILSSQSPTCNCLRSDSQQQKLIVTTRSYNNIKNALERELGRTAFTLKPLSREEQALYLKQYMEINFNSSILLGEEIMNISGFFDYMLHILSDENKHIKMVNIPLYTVYVAAVEYFQRELPFAHVFDKTDMESLKEKINSTAAFLETYKPLFDRQYDVNQLTEISENPLHLYISAEYFLSQIKDDTIVSLDKNDINNKWDVTSKSFSLFEHFLDTKFRKIKFIEKNTVDISKPENKKMFQKERTDFIEKHKRLALVALFEDKDLLASNIVSESELKEIYNNISKIDSGEEKTGVVDRVVDNTPRFVHLVFAEYFAVEYICDKLKAAFLSEIDETFTMEYKESLWDFTINKVLYQSTGGVRTFFDRKLKDDVDFLQAISCAQSKEIVFEALLKQGNKNKYSPEGFSDKLQMIKTSINIAVEESLENVQDYLLDCIKHSVNATNLAALTQIIANGMVVLSAMGSNNDALMYKLKSCLRHVAENEDKLFLQLLIPSFVKEIIPFPILETFNTTAFTGLVSTFIPQMTRVDLNNVSLTPTLRNFVSDYLKLLWDLMRT